MGHPWKQRHKRIKGGDSTPEHSEKSKGVTVPMRPVFSAIFSLEGDAPHRDLLPENRTLLTTK